MLSATDFFPSSMTEFMNFDRTMSPNFGSGRISRFSGRRRRDIGYSFLFSLVRNLWVPHQNAILMGALSGAYSCGLFRTLGAVLRTRLPAVLDALGVEHAAKDVVA